MPRLVLYLRQDVYTFILRCVDLNFAFTDMLEKKYDFRNTEEYFKSTSFLLKNGIYIKTNSIALKIFESNEVLLTELSIREPQINIMMYLNNQHNHEIILEQISSYFIKSTSHKHFLFGRFDQQHVVPIETDILRQQSLDIGLSGHQVNRSQSYGFTRKNLSQPHLRFTAEMHPDGRKYFNITLNRLKIFL